MRKMRLFQKDAYIGVDFLEKKSELIRLKDENEQSELFTFEIETPQGVKSIVIENPTSTVDNALKAELTSFRDSIVHDTNPVVSELDGYHASESAQ